MRRWLYLLAILPLSLAGCYREHDMEKDDSGGCSRGCEAGVSFELEAIQSTLDEMTPVTLRVCFDQSCDELTLSSSQDQRWCDGAPGGPPDQLTWCDFSPRGAVSVDILRVDGASYHDNQPHTAAISIKDARGQLLHSHAEVVRFSEGDCGLRRVRLAPRELPTAPPPPAADPALPEGERPLDG